MITGNISVQADAAGTALTGGSAVDILTGGAGDDTLTGNAGNDILDGAIISLFSGWRMHSSRMGI